MRGIYNAKAEGIITKVFLEKEVGDFLENKYVILRGYFDHGNTEKNKCMKLIEIMNYMYSRGFEFNSFITREHETFGEILFENKDI